MRSMLIPALLGGLVLIGLWTPEVSAQKKKVEIQKKWSGTVADRELVKAAPEIIVRKTELEKVWKSWKIEGDLPSIDFKKEIVVVVTSSQGGLLLSSATLNEKGDLELVAFVTEEKWGVFRAFVLCSEP